MAESLDVRTALVSLIAGTVYPLGTGQACAIAGIGSGGCAVFPSWPKPADIDTRLAAGDVLINTFDRMDGRDTTRYQVQDVVLSTGTQTLAWTNAGTSITLSGTISTPQNLAILVDGMGFTYAVQAGNTLPGIAQSFAAAISVYRPATASGATIAIPNSHAILGRVGSIGTTQREVGRQKATFQVTIWAPNEYLRSATVNLIKPMLDDQRRFALPDGTIATIIPVRDFPNTDPLKAAISRHDLFYSIEYATVRQGTAPQIVMIQVNESIVAEIDGAVLSGPRTTYL